MRDAFVNLAAGGMSGVTVDAVLFPLDTVKTVLQSRHAAQAQTLQFRALYRGMASAMLGSFPSAATFWVVYEASKARLSALTGGQYLPAVHASAAMLADVAVVGVRNPFEVVKQQMQVGLHKNSRHALRNILRADGVAGLYAGYFSTLVREVPFDALQFVMYEAIKSRYRKHKGDTPLVLWENCAIGSCAGALAAGVTTPLDVVKTRLMTQTGVAASERYTGVVHALRTIYAQEGARALFSGVRQRVAWIGLGGAIFFGSFEELRRLMSPAPDGDVDASH